MKILFMKVLAIDKNTTHIFQSSLIKKNIKSINKLFTIRYEKYFHRDCYNLQ